MEELRTKYNVPKKIASAWVEGDELLLLLDRLDEVAQERREACVEAINAFRQEHLVPLVVCSRSEEYKALSRQLRLQGAVLLQPLTLEQVEDYLNRAGGVLVAVRETWQGDATLREMVESPLMLNVMTLAYRGMSVEELGALEAVEARHRHTFEIYVQRMLEQRRRDEWYSPEQTVHWLA